MKKIRIPLIAVYLTIVLILICTNISFAKYTGVAKGNDSAQVAAYRINTKTTNFPNNTSTLNTLAIGGGYSYYFYVTNQDVKGNVSQVSINYTIRMQESSVKGTTLSYALYKSDINQNRGASITLGSTILSMPMATPVIQYYELVVSSSGSAKGITNVQSQVVVEAKNQ